MSSLGIELVDQETQDGREQENTEYPFRGKYLKDKTEPSGGMTENVLPNDLFSAE